MAETMYQKRTKVRRMSDIDRLAQQFSRNIESTTSEYEKSFADYQKQRAALMRPYEDKVRAYNASMATYETQAATYASKLKEYQKALEDFPTSEGTLVGPANAAGRSGYAINIGGTMYYVTEFGDNLPENYYAKKRYETRMEYPRHSPARPYQAFVGYDVYKKTPPAPFKEKAPVAPEAPTAPDLPEFDASQFEAKRKELGKTFQREVSERKAARLGAVGRRATRPMLQET